MEVASIAIIHLWLSSITVAATFAIAFDELIVGLAHHPMSLHYHILLPLHLPYPVAAVVVHPYLAINLYLYLIFSWLKIENLSDFELKFLLRAYEESLILCGTYFGSSGFLYFSSV